MPSVLSALAVAQLGLELVTTPAVSTASISGQPQQVPAVTPTTQSRATADATVQAHRPTASSRIGQAPPLAKPIHPLAIQAPVSAKSQPPLGSQPGRLREVNFSAPTAAARDPKALRDSLLIPPLVVKKQKPWPSPSLSPGVPSGFIANWGDVFVSVTGATPGSRPDVDGSIAAGFGLGDAVKTVALEIDGACGSFKIFCGNGAFDARLGRILVNKENQKLALAVAWQNFAQWGYEATADNTFYGVLTYAIPLRKAGSSFAQTLQINAGTGNSQYAPYTAQNSERAVGGFASIGVELTPYAGFSAGWSGRGANVQLSVTPFRDAPITINLSGVDVLNNTPNGTVGVLSVSWGTNFRTAGFN